MLTRLIPMLMQRSLRVSAVKHAHHAFELDQPGKDSFRYRAAGAVEVVISAGERWALMHELRGEPEPALPALLGHMAAVDLVLVEGFKRSPYRKIEVHRAALGKPLLHPGDPTFVAMAADPVLAAPIPVAALDDVGHVAELVLQYAEPWPS